MHRLANFSLFSLSLYLSRFSLAPSGARKKTVQANVQRMAVRDLADMAPLGKLGVRAAVCSMLASMVNRGADRATLMDWLDQSLTNSANSDDLYLTYEYLTIVLTRFGDASAYANSRAAPVVGDSMRVLKRADDDEDDDVLFAGGTGGKGKGKRK